MVCQKDYNYPMLTETILAGLLLGFAAAAQPGPFQTYLITQAVLHGYRKSWIAAFAPLLSDGPVILLALFMLNQIPEWLQRGLNLAGGAFILYLAWGAFKEWKNFSETKTPDTPNKSQGLIKAAFMNLLSPMPFLYWSLVAGPILRAGLQVSVLNGTAFLLSFYAILIGGLSAIMAIFSVTRRAGNSINRILLGISVLVLIGFGLFQFWRGVFG